MLCDKCKINTATIRYQQIINGKQTSLNLCSECASSGGYTSPFDINVMDLNDFIASVFNLNNTENREQVIKCPSCGYTLDKFNKTSLLGCDKCYETFKANLLPIIKNIHGSIQHVGQNNIAAASNTVDDLSKMKSELARAVENEEYELAAALRDKIRLLEGKGDKQ